MEDINIFDLQSLQSKLPVGFVHTPAADILREAIGNAIETLRTELESINVDDVRTSYIRGEIASFRVMLIQLSKEEY